MSITGVLLVNLGTPDSAEPRDVYHYLTEFLNDPRVIDVSLMVRAILNYVIITPFRYKRSAEAYRQIWTDQGSPLLYHSKVMKEALAARLGPSYQVELGMRYGHPSIQSVLDTMRHCAALVVIPLFPQYSSAVTGSAIEVVMKNVSRQWNIPNVHIYNEFYHYPGFINAYAEVIKQAMTNKQVDMTLFSYHGLPERHLDKSGCLSECSRVNACPSIDSSNHFCYRAQCYQTSRLIAKQLGIEQTQFMTTFQSRLGRTPWIKPYTDHVLVEMRQRGIKKIAIVCPSFIADCLETLEEINIRARKQWYELGGEMFHFIPSLNDNEQWINTLASFVKK